MVLFLQVSCVLSSNGEEGVYGGNVVTVMATVVFLVCLGDMTGHLLMQALVSGGSLSRKEVEW